MSSAASTTPTPSVTIPVSDSCHLLTLPRCLFNPRMRISKRPFFAFSLASLSSFEPSSSSSSSFLFLLCPSRLSSSLSASSCLNTSTAEGGEDRFLRRRIRRRRGLDRLLSSYTMDESGVESKTLQFQQANCNGSGRDRFIWSSPAWGCKIPLGKQIFCNRSLNMKSIVAVGFDMDYTLAQYMPETFESLAYDGTIRKLVYNLGYPPELLGWSFDWKYMVRGLVLDKKRGNILKMDRHKYVKVAYHGFREMSKEDKIANYGNTLIRDSFDEPDYALIDTLFSLAEAYLFAQLVDFKDSHPGKVPDGADYSRIYKDVRAAVDLCHRDGTVKQMVAKDPGKYELTRN